MELMHVVMAYVQILMKTRIIVVHVMPLHVLALVALEYVVQQWSHVAMEFVVQQGKKVAMGCVVQQGKDVAMGNV
jgi:hypothetical protein